MVRMNQRSNVTWRALLLSQALVVALIIGLLIWGPVTIGAQELDQRALSAQESSSPVAEGVAQPEYTFASPTNWAFLATGVNFPDALGVGSVAGFTLGPTLLVQQSSIPDDTLDELNRLQPEHVMIIGGTAVISDAVLNQVAALPYTTDVQRISGTNRYATAAAVSNAFYGTTGYYPRAHFAFSDDLPDGDGTVLTQLEMPFFETGDGILLAHASIDVTRNVGANGEDTMWCAIFLDTVVVPGSARWVTVDGDERICATDAAVVVGEGQHTVDFRMSASVNTNFWAGTLTGLYNPFQGEGLRISP